MYGGGLTPNLSQTRSNVSQCMRFTSNVARHPGHCEGGSRPTWYVTQEEQNGMQTIWGEAGEGETCLVRRKVVLQTFSPTYTKSCSKSGKENWATDAANRAFLLKSTPVVFGIPPVGK